jgi:DNA-binding CsgD family transcriptional regulator
MLVDDLLTTCQRLRLCETVPELFRVAAALAPAACGFDRAVVAAVVDGRITAIADRPLAHAGSETLRLRLLDGPPLFLPAADDPSWAALSTRLGLGSYAYAPVRPTDTTLGLLVVDRAEPPETPDDAEAVRSFADMLAVSLERVILRRRARTLAAEVRQFAGLAHGLARDVVEGTVALPSDHGLGPALPRPAGLCGGHLGLSAREQRVAELLVDGRSNREIADLLILSPETVKTHVTRIRRKLGAANRVEAVSLLLRASP